MINYYKILGLPSSATKEDIKNAYRQLAQKHHPDTGIKANAKRFAEIVEAYRLLKEDSEDPEHEKKKPESTPINQNLYQQRIDPQRKKEQQAFYRSKFRQAILKVTALTLIVSGTFYWWGLVSEFYPTLSLGVGLLTGLVLGLNRFFDLETFLSPKLFKFSRWIYWLILGWGTLYVLGIVFHLFFP